MLYLPPYIHWIFLHPSTKLLPAIMVSYHMEEKQSLLRLKRRTERPKNTLREI